MLLSVDTKFIHLTLWRIRPGGMAALNSNQLEDTVVACFDRGAFSKAIEILSDAEFTQISHAESMEDSVLRRRQLRAVAELLKLGHEGGDDRYFMERHGAFAKLVHPDKCRMEATRYCEKAFRILQQCKKHSLQLAPGAAVAESDFRDGDHVWWDSWDGEDKPYDGENKTHDDQDDVEELAALSIDEMKEEVQKREDALWGDSTTLSLEERRLRLVRAREILADKVQRKVDVESEELAVRGGGFLPE